MDTTTRINHAAIIQRLRDIRFEMQELDDSVFALSQDEEITIAGLGDAYDDFDRKFLAARVSIDRIIDAIDNGLV